MSKTIEISDELYSQIKVQLDEDGAKEVNTYEDLIGGKYYFRTVTIIKSEKSKK